MIAKGDEKRLHTQCLKRIAGYELLLSFKRNIGFSGELQIKSNNKLIRNYQINPNRICK
jgi:hypothetical protein